VRSLQLQLAVHIPLAENAYECMPCRASSVFSSARRGTDKTHGTSYLSKNKDGGTVKKEQDGLGSRGVSEGLHESAISKVL
jgi:hypothetical protein